MVLERYFPFLTAWKYAVGEAWFKFKREILPFFECVCVGDLLLELPASGCSAPSHHLTPTFVAPRADLLPALARLLQPCWLLELHRYSNAKLHRRRCWEGDGEKRSSQIFKMSTAPWWSISPAPSQDLGSLGRLVGRVLPLALRLGGNGEGSMAWDGCKGSCLETQKSANISKHWLLPTNTFKPANRNKNWRSYCSASWYLDKAFPAGIYGSNFNVTFVLAKSCHGPSSSPSDQQASPTGACKPCAAGDPRWPWSSPSPPRASFRAVFSGFVGKFLTQH